MSDARASRRIYNRVCERRSAAAAAPADTLAVVAQNFCEKKAQTAAAAAPLLLLPSCLADGQPVVAAADCLPISPEYYSTRIQATYRAEEAAVVGRPLVGPNLQTGVRILAKGKEGS